MSIQQEQTLLISVTANELPIQQQVAKPRSCLPKYKVRKFSSKGAMLVLFWNFSVLCCFGSPVYIDHVYKYSFDRTIAVILAYFLWLIVSVVSVWLADVYFGRHKVVRTGLVLSWIGQLCVCANALVRSYSKSEPKGVEITLTIGLYVFWYSGAATVFVNSIQLGIDQMPTASTDELTSFIYSNMLCANIGIVTGVLLVHWARHTIVIQVGFAVLLTISLILDFLLSKTWIAHLPVTGNPFKGVYRVLKYAWKHKYPVQRSAFTYWEDKIPSRIDFGKEKYGGPFTTEQVEDVKTIFRLFIICIPSALVMLSTTTSEGIFEYENHIVTFHNLKNISSQEQMLLIDLVGTPTVWVMIMLLISELVVYPLARKYIPSMLKRIGIGIFTIIPYCLIFLAISILAHIQGTTVNIFWLRFPTGALAGIRTMLLMTTYFEFICAQSPLAVKGFFIGYLWSLNSLSIVIAKLVFFVWNLQCSNKPENNGCAIAYYSFALAVGVIAFIVYCILAKWYKRRSRDEPFNTHTLVEEVYDRYVAHNTLSGSNMTVQM